MTNKTNPIKTPTFGFSSFVRRQTVHSSFSCTVLPDREVLRRIRKAWDKAVPGYRDGVMLVPVDPEGFYSATCTLEAGDVLKGVYKPRRAGETPRKHVGVVGGKKLPAGRCDIVLYRHDVLEDTDWTPYYEECTYCNGTGKDFLNLACNDCKGVGSFQVMPDWEIVSINAGAGETPEPMSVGTMLANHFGDQGGTLTQMTDQELVAALRESYWYWRDKALVAE